MKKICIAILAFILAPSAFAAEKSFRLFAVEQNGVKFWLPSTIVVNKGDKVKLELTNKIEDKAGNVHGFAIPEFKVMEAVEFGKPAKIVEFTADKKGIYATSCHLHPAHVGGQLVVE